MKATHGSNLETMYKSKINDNQVLKPIELRWSCCLLNHNYIRRLGDTLIIKFYKKLISSHKIAHFPHGPSKGTSFHFPLNVKRWLQCNALNNSTHTTHASPLATLLWNLHSKVNKKTKTMIPLLSKARQWGKRNFMIFH